MPPPTPPPKHTQTPSSAMETTTTTAHLFLNSSTTKSLSNPRYILLLTTNYLLLLIGSVASTLLTKFYFNHHGASRWVSTWIQSAGFPILLIPIYFPTIFLGRRRPFANFTPKLLTLSILIGFMLGLSNFLFSLGISYLPVSTSSLLLSTQLAFTLLLSAVIVGQKFTFMNLNCVVLLTLSSVLIGITSSHDRPNGLTQRDYFVGFFSAVGAGLLFALYLPLMERIYKMVYCYEMVVEMQFIMEASATLAATIGMAAGGGFNEMKHEARTIFDLGPTKYWITISTNLVVWQLCFMGTAGMVFLTTSLTGGICMTALLAMNVLSGVIVYGEYVSGPKVVSTLMCTWAFLSYVYGMYVRMKRNDHQGKAGGEVEVDRDPEGGGCAGGSSHGDGVNGFCDMEITNQMMNR